MDKYITTKEAAESWHITQRQVQIHCKKNRIKGVVKIGNTYLIPRDAKRPMYGYYSESRPEHEQLEKPE